MSTTSGRLTVSIDTHIREASPNSNFNAYAYFAVSNPGSSAEIRTLLTPPRPTAVGLAANKVLGAVLRLTQRGGWTEVHTLTIRLLTASYREDTVTWANKPGARTGSGAMTAAVTGVADGTVHEIDLATLFENAANNGWDYYGIALSTDATTAALFYSENDAGGRQATIEYEWAVEPSRPTSLHPAAARSATKPRFLASTAGVDVASQQVQVSTSSDFTSPIRDNTIGSLAQQAIDYSPGTEFTALPSDATYYWRCRYTTPDGLTSPWSATQSFAVKAKPTIAITSVIDAVTNDITPTISWTYSAGEGGAQSQYQVTISEYDPIAAVYLAPAYNARTGKWSGGWKSGAVRSAATSLSVPDGALKTGRRYKLRVDLWDSVARDDERSDRAFQTDETEWLLNVDAATTGVTELTVTQAAKYPEAEGSAGPSPIVHLAWTRGSTPDRYRVLRRLVTEAVYEVLADEPASEFAAEFGSGWEYYDVAPGGLATEYKVLAIVGVKPSQTTNLNPFFLLAASSWHLHVDGAAAAVAQGLDDSGALGGKILNVAITDGGTEIWHIDLDQTLPAATSGKVYPVSIRLRSREGTRSVRVALRRSDPPYTEYAGETFDIGPNWVTKSWTWTLGDSVTPQIILYLGTDTGDVDIDYFTVEVSPGIERITPEVYGFWLVAESDQSLAVPLVVDAAGSEQIDEARVELHPLGGKHVVIRNPEPARRFVVSAIIDQEQGDYLGRLDEIRRRALTCYLVSLRGQRYKVQLLDQSADLLDEPSRMRFLVRLDLAEVD